MVNNDLYKSSTFRITKENASELGKKGGSVCSENKKIAARLRHLKLKGLTDDRAQKLYDLITSKDVTQLEILKYIEGMIEVAQSGPEKLRLVELLLKWSKHRFGDKIDIDQKVTVVDWNDTITKVLTRDSIIEGELVEDNNEDNNTENNNTDIDF